MMVVCNDSDTSRRVRQFSNQALYSDHGLWPMPKCLGLLNLSETMNVWSPILASAWCAWTPKIRQRYGLLNRVYHLTGTVRPQDRGQCLFEISKTARGIAGTKGTSCVSVAGRARKRFLTYNISYHFLNPTLKANIHLRNFTNQIYIKS
jgi:hypothetical protein